MDIRRIEPAQIGAHWRQIRRALYPAIRFDEHRGVDDVKRELESGRLEIVHITIPEGGGHIVTETIGERCTIVYAAGAVSGGPRKWLAIMRAGVRFFEWLARKAGCTEMRVEGRDWSRVLPDYERLTERPGRNELRKVL